MSPLRQLWWSLVVLRMPLWIPHTCCSLQKSLTNKSSAAAAGGDVTPATMTASLHLLHITEDAMGETRKSRDLAFDSPHHKWNTVYYEQMNFISADSVVLLFTDAMTSKEQPEREDLNVIRSELLWIYIIQYLVISAGYDP